MDRRLPYGIGGCDYNQVDGDANEKNSIDNDMVVAVDSNRWGVCAGAGVSGSGDDGSASGDVYF